ncbi:hypothetical protein [Methylocapsa sp. S129]|uniref:hypothetical protein n=1 Tax=Methylocapsa sp. S129 TaxID=1641869 RepID=UPI00131B9F10|nr:hypothetical protein [Methylocapsa sp. S129]
MLSKPSSWSYQFSKPIALKDGRKIATLAEARDFVLALPSARQIAPLWQYAVALMLEVAYRSGKPALTGARMQLKYALRAEGLL